MEDVASQGFMRQSKDLVMTFEIISVFPSLQAITMSYSGIVASS